MSTEKQTQADQMKRASRTIIEKAVTGRDLDVLDQVYSPDLVWHGPGGREIKGLEGMKEMISGYQAAFPDLRMTAERQIAEGDTLAVEWRCVGTHDGPLGDIPPTGKRIDIRGHVMARFERGKIVEEFEVFDELRMLQQVGAVEL